MRERAISGLPVVDPNGGLVGVLSRTDVVEDGSIPMAILLRKMPSGLRVGELMSSPAITVETTDPLIEAARRMRDNRIHRLVAVDDTGRPVGILSASDFVALFAEG
jgi:CBS domain-containing protein